MFTVGQKVIATENYAYQVTKGKIYTVIKYEPKHHVFNFTYPAYVTVLGDFGDPITGHCHRFKLLEEVSEGNHE